MVLLCFNKLILSLSLSYAVIFLYSLKNIAFDNPTKPNPITKAFFHNSSNFNLILLAIDETS